MAIARPTNITLETVIGAQCGQLSSLFITHFLVQAGVPLASQISTGIFTITGLILVSFSRKIPDFEKI